VKQPARSWFQPGDTVRYVGRPREDGVSLIPGTLGSVVALPVVRRRRLGGVECLACQDLFGSHTVWIAVERLAAEWDA
jgi:hypothetical protein